MCAGQQHSAPAHPALRRARRELNAWLDQAEVRRALHAAPEHVTGRFQECTNRLNYTHDQPSMLANHRFLLSKGTQPHAAPRLHGPSPTPHEYVRAFAVHEVLRGRGCCGARSAIRAGSARAAWEGGER